MGEPASQTGGLPEPTSQPGHDATFNARRFAFSLVFRFEVRQRHGRSLQSQPTVRSTSAAREAGPSPSQWQKLPAPLSHRQVRSMTL